MYIYYKGSDGSVRTLGDNELAHYNHNHDALGRFARGSGSSPTQRAKIISSKINKIDAKTGKLQRKAAKYTAKASKYQRKSNKVKRLASNPLIGLTDANRGANYAALRYEGKGLKYTQKAANANKKISKLNNKRIKLGQERVKLLEQQYPDVFEPGWRDKYKDLGPDAYNVTAYKKGNEYTVVSNSRKKK